MQNIDVIVIGGGMAGACAAYALSPTRSVVLLERESALGYHTTGRSAALYIEGYGNESIRALTRAGREFFLKPPSGFCEHPLLSPRGVLYVGADGDDIMASLTGDDPPANTGAGDLSEISAHQAMALCPALRPEAFSRAVHDRAAMDIDVHALHQGFLKGARAHGAQVLTNQAVQFDRRQGAWIVTSADQQWRCSMLVNAAGAWADALGQALGASPIGLQPMRRTAITFDPPDRYDISQWPAVVDCNEQWYLKPDAGRLLASPADETPSAPCDAQPEELDVALAAHRVEQVTDLSVARLVSTWAGLRSFVPDRSLVIGPDAQVDGLFWVAGQGGYGIQTAPGAMLAIRAMASQAAWPAELVDLGLVRTALLPDRCQRIGHAGGR